MSSRTPRSAAKNPKNSKKGAAILKAAEHIFARKGFQAATVADIAKKAKVSEATIYEYFSSKEELLFAIPAEIIREYEEKDREILHYIQGAANKLRFLIHRQLDLYDSNPDYATVAMLLLKGNPNFLKTDSYKIIRLAARNYIKVIEEGMETNEFRDDIDPYLLRAMIWGTIEHLVTRKSLLGKPENLASLTDSLFNTIFNGIRADQASSPIRVHVNVTRSD
ncbi:MAG: TetR/AcrR family transcriptional regulator [Desulfobacteraceae bacterium]|nr:TetR/AcrR family transcriptional regulator [Desulfobacteraceae bacterium]